MNYRDPEGLIIQVDPAHQSTVLTTLSQFVKGDMSFNSRGILKRYTDEDDDEIENIVDQLIKSEKKYVIIPERKGFGGEFHPWSQVEGRFGWQYIVGEGGKVYFDGDPCSHKYPYTPVGPWYAWGAKEHFTPGTILAHELLGRAYADLLGEPQGEMESKVRNKANKKAVDRANPAFDRMGKPRRGKY